MGVIDEKVFDYRILKKLEKIGKKTRLRFTFNLIRLYIDIK